uniref:hypothetical protein n=1 Tax=Mesorhizobium sp. GR13 TaxID=2562308 RepID=UPI00197CF22C
RALMFAVKDEAKRLRSAREPRLMVNRAWVEAELKDVGDQALIRGLATAFPIVRPGLLLSYCGRRSIAGHKARNGHSPAVVPPPPMCEGYILA